MREVMRCAVNLDFGYLTRRGFQEECIHPEVAGEWGALEDRESIGNNIREKVVKKKTETTNLLAM